MTKSEKIEFVRLITVYIVKEVVDLIYKDKLPSTWDAIELRQILADKFKASTWQESGSRSEEYRSEVLARKLI